MLLLLLRSLCFVLFSCTLISFSRALLCVAHAGPGSRCYRSIRRLLSQPLVRFEGSTATRWAAQSTTLPNKQQRQSSNLMSPRRLSCQHCKTLTRAILLGVQTPNDGTNFTRWRNYARRTQRKRRMPSQNSETSSVQRRPGRKTFRCVSACTTQVGLPKPRRPFYCLSTTITTREAAHHPVNQ